MSEVNNFVMFCGDGYVCDDGVVVVGYEVWDDVVLFVGDSGIF